MGRTTGDGLVVLVRGEPAQIAVLLGKL